MSSKSEIMAIEDIKDINKLRIMLKEAQAKIEKLQEEHKAILSLIILTILPVDKSTENVRALCNRIFEDNCFSEELKDLCKLIERGING